MMAKPSALSATIPILLALGIFVLCLLSADKKSSSLKHGITLSKLNKVLTNDLSQPAKVDDANNLTSKTIKVQISNEYIERDGMPQWKYPWLNSVEEEDQILLAEPYRENVFFVVVEDKTLATLSSTFFEWYIISPDGKTTEHHNGQSITLTFTELAKYQIIIRQRGLDNEILTEKHVKVMVKYVRREIRSLTDEDLEATLDAMAVLWSIPQSVGEKMYGDNYKSAAELLKVHLKLAGDPSCDHMHDGMGFVPHHSAMTLLFERSIQAVNPKVSLPYWDYGIDFQKIQDNGGSLSDFHDFVNSELFSEKYFGATDTNTHYVKDGRWKDLQVPKNDYLTEEELETMPYNAFGYMRAPWSSNSDPHMLRATTMCGVESADWYPVPDCSSFQSLYQKDSLQEFGKYVSYDPHGPVHIILGGALHCTESYHRLYDVFGADADDQVGYFQAFAYAAHKNLYRWDIIQCGDEEQSCSCPDLDEYMSTPEGREYFFYHMRPSFAYGSYTPEQLEMIADVVCNSHLVDGDQMQASSSYAPEFWPIHPTLERIYQWKKISNDFDDMSWYEGSGTWNDEAYNVDLCTGHRADDIVLDGMLPVQIGEKSEITNGDFYLMLDPNVDVLPYVYDNFDWSYCDATGYSF
mmetsp:Transcript_30141/g.38713  ORF Transcript_30141/g.38713 Transcript_30141/m.38713 type:complete len:635 (+) Transcript_30141:70-1974(+)